jgi:hypothetical protein
MGRLGLETGLPPADAAAIPPPAVAVRPRASALTDPSWTTPGRPRERRPASHSQPAQRAGVVASAAVAIAFLLVLAGYLAAGSSPARQAEARTASTAATPAAALETVFLAVVSDPHGAIAEATWNQGKKTGITPFEVEVPKSTRVRFEFTKPGYAPVPYVVELVAETSQLVEGKLLVEQRPGPPPPAPRLRKPPEPPKPAESKPPDADEGDDAMEIVF